MTFIFAKPVVDRAAVSFVASMLLALLTVPQVSAIELTPSEVPLAAASHVAPMVMINLSKDHSLFFKAYNDYTALKSGSSEIQTTYDNSIEYYGYFDSAKCYRYTARSALTRTGLFVPATLASNHYCASGAGLWSGNFMNWAGMTRMDAVRRLLYGGMRTTDTAHATVLSRAATATDGHAFAKYYNGPDIDRLTPFSNAPAHPILTSSTLLTLSPSRAAGHGRYAANAPTYTFVIGGQAIYNAYVQGSDLQLGDVVRLQSRSRPAAYVEGYVSVLENGSLGTARVGITVHATGIPASLNSPVSASDWNLTVLNQTDGGITLCSMSPSADPVQSMLRVARGNYQLWAANERWQCRWHEEVNGTQQAGSSNGNVPLVSGLDAAADNPLAFARALSSSPGPAHAGEYYMNVQACDASILKDGSGAPAGTERCKRYPSGIYKPVGLLQVHGDNERMQFGLMTGSYSKNISGGVLRRELAPFTTEVNVDTDGTFVDATKMKGIVYHIDRFGLPGYDFRAGNYLGLDQCTYGLKGLVHSGGRNETGFSQNEGACVEWGNPVAEMYLETLRYLAGKQPDRRFLYDENAPRNIDKRRLGMVQKSTWIDPLSNDNYCAPLNIVVLNSAYTSYDSDQMDRMRDLGTTRSAQEWTKLVGDGEQITGKRWLVGDNGTASSTQAGKSCTAKTIHDFGAVSGICPEAPAHEGSFLIAGTAYYAHTQRIRADLDAIPAKDIRSLKVDTYGVQLASATPRITVSIKGKSVVIQPSYRLHVIDNARGINSVTNGTLVDFRILSQTPTAGSFLVIWEDSAQGGDFDQDTWGIISYRVEGEQLAVTTSAVSSASANGQGLGYVITGTNRDGTHYHSGAYNFVYHDPDPVVVTPALRINSSGGCQGCNAGDAPTTALYTAAGSATNVLHDPLYYAAKWGGFDVAASKTDPPAPSAAAAVDNYFYVTNPGQLEHALGSALSTISKRSGASAAATNGPTFNSATALYQATYNPANWSGQLYSYPFTANKDKAETPNWEVGEQMSHIPHDDRVILTFDATPSERGGIPFRYSQLPAAYRTLLDTDSLGHQDGRAADRVGWLRGDRSQEGISANNLRSRLTPLGDIVNASPTFVGTPSAGYTGASYKHFAQRHALRRNMLYVGANDGMMHAVAVDNGRTLFSYVPSVVMPKLAALTHQNYSHQYYADGSPVIHDAFFNGAWHTTLVAGMNRGGRAVYALDVSNPESVAEIGVASVVLWEFTAAVDPDLGYTFGRPAIVKLANGKWAAVFGNGYQSEAGRAYLYIVFLDRKPGSKQWTEGVDYLKMATNLETGNGLSEVLPVDTTGRGTTTFVYAGDLNGNLWKFDLAAQDQKLWKLAYGAPLFTTPRQLVDSAGSGPGSNKVTRPITTAPDIMRHPQRGYMLVFGTGVYLQTTDPANRDVQALYGIWDDLNDAGQNQLGSGSIAYQPYPVQLSELHQQTIIGEFKVNAGRARVTTREKVDFMRQRGWYLELASGPGFAQQGERIVYNPSIYGGRIVVTTLISSQVPCKNGGSGWLMALDALSGSRVAFSTLDVNGDQQINPFDEVTIAPGETAVASGLQLDGIPADFTRVSGTDTNRLYTGGVPGNTLTESPVGATGRLSWRAILN